MDGFNAFRLLGVLLRAHLLDRLDALHRVLKRERLGLRADRLKNLA